MPLPEIVDPNGDETLVEVDPLYTSNFLEWTPVSEELVFIIGEDVLPGYYDFMIILSDIEDSSNYPIRVTVLENTAPYFVDELWGAVYKIGTGINFYQLPRVIDEELDFIKIDAVVPPQLTATYNLAGITFTIDNDMDEGEYKIDIALTDGYATTNYELYISVIQNTLPYFVEDVGPLVYRQGSGI